MRKPLLLLWAVAAVLLLQTVAGNNEFDDDITFDDVPTRPEGPGRPEESSLGSRIINSLSRIKRGLWDSWFQSSDENSKTSSSEDTTTTDSSSTTLTTALPPSVESTVSDGTTHSREARSTTSSGGSPSPRVGDDEDDLSTASGSGSELDATTRNLARSDSYVIFRIRVYIHEFWNPNFAQKNSAEFEKFAKNFTHELQVFYDEPVGDDEALPGSRRATVIGIEPSDDSMLILVTADLGSKGYDESDTIKHRLKRHLQSSSRLGTFTVKIDNKHPLTIQKFTEPNTNGFSPCEVTQLACTDGLTCLSLDKRCDGEANCPDGSDEEGCPTTDESNVGLGPSRSAGLANPQSIPEDLTPARCDDRKLCPNKKKWICASMVCDGIQDCPEISEEEGCPDEDGTAPVTPSSSTTPETPSTTTTYTTNCYTNEFMCDLTRCLQSSQRCDGRLDCADGTDEEGCPKNREYHRL